MHARVVTFSVCLFVCLSQTNFEDGFVLSLYLHMGIKAGTILYYNSATWDIYIPWKLLWLKLRMVNQVRTNMSKVYRIQSSAFTGQLAYCHKPGLDPGGWGGGGGGGMDPPSSLLHLFKTALNYHN